MGSVPVGRRKRADGTGGPQTFRSPTAVLIWWVWLLFAAANLVDLAVQGRDHLSLVAAAILVLVTGVAYVTAQRPRIIARDADVTVVNPLRDHHIGWAGVSQVDLTDLLRLHCDVGPAGSGPDGKNRTKIIYCWAVHYSRRRKLAAEARTRRQAARAGSGRSFGAFGLGYGGGGGGPAGGYGTAPAASTAEAEAERIVRILSEHATAGRAEAVWAGGTVDIAAGPEPAGADTIEPATAPAETQDARVKETAEARVKETADARVKETAEAWVNEPLVNGWSAPLTSTWNRRAILALLVPALILLVVCLV